MCVRARTRACAYMRGRGTRTRQGAGTLWRYVSLTALPPAGADPNINCLQTTPLYLACFHGQIALAETLLGYGVAHPRTHARIQVCNHTHHTHARARVHGHRHAQHSTAQHSTAQHARRCQRERDEPRRTLPARCGGEGARGASPAPRKAYLTPLPCPRVLAPHRVLLT